MVTYGLDHPSPFESIPRELFWLIVEFAPEVVHHLKMTSTEIKSHVDHFAMASSSIRIVPFCRVEKFDSMFNIEIIVPTNRIHIFAARLHFFQIPDEVRSRMSTYTDEHLEFYYNEQFTVFDFSIQDDDNFPSVMENLRKCIGKRIGQVSFNTELAMVPKLFHGIHIDCLHFTFETLSNGTFNGLLKIIDAHKVDKLVLTVFRTTVSAPVDCLLQLASLVSSMRIIQQEIKEVERNGSYFFGLQNTVWAPIFLEMLSRKLSKLRICNKPYTTYQSCQEVDFLIQGLPKLGKKIWIQVPLKYPYPPCEYVDNDHRVIGII